MPNTYQIGRVGRVYIGEEASYGTAPTLVAGDAVRHLAALLNENPRNRVDSPERHTHPSLIYRFTRRQSANGRFRGLFYPSGTLNTLPDHDLLLLNGFGARTNVTLATTIAASPAPTTTVFTVGSVGTLAVGDAVLIDVTTGTPATGKVVRFITAINTLALTVDPPLPQAPAATDTVKGCITYKLATALPKSLTMAKYLTSLSLELNGWVADELDFTFDANEEPTLEVNGPAKDRIRPAQADPVTYTVVGTTPPSGLTGTLRIGATVYEFLNATVKVTNETELDNVAFGTSAAQNFYRRNKRGVTFAVRAMHSSDVSLLADAEATTDRALLVQCGQTQGSIIGIYAPTVEFEVPEDADDEETMQLSFQGVCKGSAAGNDELRLCVA